MAFRKNYFPSSIQYSNSIDRQFEFEESDIWNNSIDRQFEFEESDIWNNSDSQQRISPEPHQNLPPPRSRKRSTSRKPAAPSSLPVNIPDWSKIYGASEDQDPESEEEEEDDDEVDDRVPPHEYVARQLARRSAMVVAFSVQEGTFKGRDLRRLRNAIWKRTGFQD